MIFPPDSEIREFASYYIRAIKIFKEEFKDSVGREPSEFELTDFSKMGIIPFGFVPKQNGFQKSPQDHASTSQNSSVNKENTNPPAQTKDQPSTAQRVSAPNGWAPEILGFIKKYPQNLKKESDSMVKVVPGIPKDEWNNTVRRTFENNGWLYDWERKEFLYRGVKA